MELATGVCGLKQSVSRDGRSMTFYPAAIQTPRGILLIDTNYQGRIDVIESSLEDVGIDFDDIWGVLLTHHDSDHAGALSEIRQRNRVITFAHTHCAPYVDGRNHPMKGPADSRYPPVGVDVELVGGETFATRAGPMEVVFTPGHAPGHVSLYFPEAELLLAADALTATGGRLSRPNKQYTPDMDQSLQSAKKVADRTISRILCFHGGIVEADESAIADLVDGSP